MKNNNISLTVAVIAIIISLFVLIQIPGKSISIEDSTFQKILERDKITVCYMPWAPSVVKDPNTGKLSGFVIEIFEEIAKDADLKVEYVESTWGGFSADLNTGKCDVSPVIYPTIGRATSVSFTRPYLYSGNSAVVKASDTKFETIEDLNKAGVKVAVIQGEYAHIYAEKYMPNSELVVLEKGSDNTAPLVAVSSGQADAGLIQSDTIIEYVKIHPELKEMSPGKPYSTTPNAMAVRMQDQELLNFLDNALSYLKATGTLDGIVKRNSPSGWYSLEQDYVVLA